MISMNPLLQRVMLRKAKAQRISCPLKDYIRFYNTQPGVFLRNSSKGVSVLWKRFFRRNKSGQRVR